jgi:hypothetical protein
MKVFVAWPTALEVFFAAPATTGCKEMMGRLALSWIIAVSYEELWSQYMKKGTTTRNKTKICLEKRRNKMENESSETNGDGGSWFEVEEEQSCRFQHTHSLLASECTNLTNSSFCCLHSLSWFADPISYLLAANQKEQTMYNLRFTKPEYHFKGGPLQVTEGNPCIA